MGDVPGFTRSSRQTSHTRRTTVLIFGPENSCVKNLSKQKPTRRIFQDAPINSKTNKVSSGLYLVVAGDCS